MTQLSKLSLFTKSSIRCVCRSRYTLTVDNVETHERLSSGFMVGTFKNNLPLSYYCRATCSFLREQQLINSTFWGVKTCLKECFEAQIFSHKIAAKDITFSCSSFYCSHQSHYGTMLLHSSRMTSHYYSRTHFSLREQFFQWSIPVLAHPIIAETPALLWENNNPGDNPREAWVGHKGIRMVQSWWVVMYNLSENWC